MNYLAHAYLSFGRDEILVGNMISDFVKGKNKFDYSAGIQNGIALHRAIDGFTDAHPVTAKAKEIFRPAYRLYAGAFVDVVYDHFLAADKHEFSDAAALQAFTRDTYASLQAFMKEFPARFASMFPHMKEHDWLYNYQFRWGIERSFGGLRRRAAYITETATAFALFNDHYTQLEECYRVFFPEVKKFAQHYLQKLPP